MNKREHDIVRSGLIAFILFAMLFVSCSDEENIVVFTSSEVIRLLSNDSSKFWERKQVIINGKPSEVSECELFTNTEYIRRNDSLIYITTSMAEFCNGNSEILDSGFWDVLEESTISDRIDRIAYYSVDGDTTIKKMREITSMLLVTENDTGSSVIQETFESTLPY